MSSYLNHRGYAILKSSLTLYEINTIKQDLTVTPIDLSGYGTNPQNNSFKIYLESVNKLYLPKYYGLQKFGIPSINKMNEGKNIDIEFIGNLREKQLIPINLVINACKNPSKMGALLCLACGEGKTVCAIYAICQLAKKTLIVVHKDFLLQQWRERIQQFAPDARIGLIKAKIIDVENKDIVIASLQSLAMKDYDPLIFCEFGNVIFDECHHLSAKVFSQALMKTNFIYSIGLSATPIRKDGLTKVFKWYIGDIEFISKKRTDVLEIRFKKYYDDNPDYSTEHTLWNGKPNVSKLINSVCEFVPRVEFIVNEILNVLNEEPERRFLVLSDRRNHLHLLKNCLDSKKDNIDSGYYYGGMKDHQLKETEKKQIIYSTIQYVKEGLDIKGLDTMILASPKTDVIQISGRILRDKIEDRKHVPLIIDIVDTFGVFTNQSKKRYKYYKSCKYNIIDNDCLFRQASSSETDKNNINSIIIPNKCIIQDDEEQITIITDKYTPEMHFF
jgi:superfamily II DNA or RNA helicase